MSTRPRTAALLLSSLLAAAALLSGCGGGEEPAGSSTDTSAPESTGSPASSTSASATDDGSTAAPPFPADTAPDTGDASSDAAVTVSDIRVGRHDGFDRVVFEVDGTGTPGWDVRYVDQAFSQGSGDAVDVAGDAVLQVTLTGAAYPFETGVEEFTGGPVRGGTDVVTEVAWDATFEGTSVAFVGTAATVPFRVYQLTGPTRVVVEVAHRG